MFMVLSSWQNHYESSPSSYDECRTAPSGRGPSDQAKRPGLSSPVGCQKATPTIAIYYYYSAQKLILILPFMEGRRLSRPRHCSKGAQPVPKAVYHSDVYDKHATAHGEIRTLVLSHRSQACYC